MPPKGKPNKWPCQRCAWRVEHKLLLEGGLKIRPHLKDDYFSDHGETHYKWICYWCEACLQLDEMWYDRQYDKYQWTCRNWDQHLQLVKAQYTQVKLQDRTHRTNLHKRVVQRTHREQLQGIGVRGHRNARFKELKLDEAFAQSIRQSTIWNYMGGFISISEKVKRSSEMVSYTLDSLREIIMVLREKNAFLPRKDGESMGQWILRCCDYCVEYLLEPAEEETTFDRPRNTQLALAQDPWNDGYEEEAASWTRVEIEAPPAESQGVIPGHFIKHDSFKDLSKDVEEARLEADEAADNLEKTILGETRPLKHIQDEDLKSKLNGK